MVRSMTTGKSRRLAAERAGAVRDRGGSGDHIDEIGSEVPHVGDLDPSAVGDLDPSAVQRDALLALTTLGFKKREAERALTAAQQLVKPDAGLEPLLRAALRELR